MNLSASNSHSLCARCFLNLSNNVYGIQMELPNADNLISGPWQRNFVDARFSSVPHVSDRLELHNNNWASWILHPGPSESDVYSNIIQEPQSNDLLHMVRLLMRLDTPLHGNNARGAKYAVYYVGVAMHTVFENIKWLHLKLRRIRNVAVSSLACLFLACISSSETCYFLCKHKHIKILGLKILIHGEKKPSISHFQIIFTPYHLFASYFLT